MRRCSRALILNDEHQLLVFERQRYDDEGTLHHYYSIPGGGIEPGETPERAVVREMEEEMLITIQVDKALMHQLDFPDDREHYYFLAHITHGTPTFNLSSEEALKDDYQKNSYAVAWVSLTDPRLAYHPAYGQAAMKLQEWVDQGTFPDQMVDISTGNR